MPQKQKPDGRFGAFGPCHPAQPRRIAHFGRRVMTTPQCPIRVEEWAGSPCPEQEASSSRTLSLAWAKSSSSCCVYGGDTRLGFDDDEERRSLAVHEQKPVTASFAVDRSKFLWIPHWGPVDLEHHVARPETGTRR